MTNIEQLKDDDITIQFFKTFGIGKRCLHPKDCIHKGACKGVVACEHYNYPQITDRVLLELICILNTVTSPDLGEINYGRLKLCILEECINALNKVDWQNRIPCKSEYIKEIQSLFREENEK